MKSVLNKDIKTLFLSKDSKYSIIDKYNIILSPELYWIRVFDIPVDSKSQINKLLPTLFEDILPEQDYEYHAIKLDGSKYTCFAYKSSEIIEVLKQSGLSLNRLNNIYFAQTELSNQAPFKYNESAYIQKDNCLIKIPKNFINDNASELNTINIKLSNNKIKLNLHQNLLSTKNTYILSAIFLIIALFNFFTISSINSEMDKLVENKAKIKKEQKLPATTIQLTSMSKSLDKIDKKQKGLRELVKNIFDIHKKVRSSKITHMQYNGKILLTIENITFYELKNELKKHKIKQISNKNNILKVEIQI